jgi:hypothetical protein
MNDSAVYIGLAAVAVIVLVMFFVRRRAPLSARMLVVAPHPQWRPLDAPAPVSPRLLFSPYLPNGTLRCYNALTHESGLHVTMGVFESPQQDAIVFVSERLLVDNQNSSQLHPNVQRVTAGRLQGAAKTGWIRAAEDPASLVGNVNWYFPEVGTKRVHFVSTFIATAMNAEEGERATDLVSSLIATLDFVADDASSVPTVEI